MSNGVGITNTETKIGSTGAPPLGSGSLADPLKRPRRVTIPHLVVICQRVPRNWSALGPLASRLSRSSELIRIDCLPVTS